MSLLEIVTYGDEFLRQTAEPVHEMNSELRELIQNMGETMYDSQGIGLAAPQVGVGLRLLVLDVDQVEQEERKGKKAPKPERKLQVFINPEILEESNDDVPFNEGCLSIPDVRADVFRPSRIKLRYRDIDFQEHVIEADELLARVLQHEIDHLDGILFVDHLGRGRRLTLAGKLNRLKKSTMARLQEKEKKEMVSG